MVDQFAGSGNARWLNVSSGDELYGSSSTLTELSYHSARNFSDQRRRASAAMAVGTINSVSNGARAAQASHFSRQPLPPSASSHPSAAFAFDTVSAASSIAPSSTLSVVSKKCFLTRGVKSVLNDISSCMLAVFRSVYRHKRCASDGVSICEDQNAQLADGSLVCQHHSHRKRVADYTTMDDRPSASATSGLELNDSFETTFDLTEVQIIDTNNPVGKPRSVWTDNRVILKHHQNASSDQMSFRSAREHLADTSAPVARRQQQLHACIPNNSAAGSGGGVASFANVNYANTPTMSSSNAIGTSSGDMRFADLSANVSVRQKHARTLGTGRGGYNRLSNTSSALFAPRPAQTSKQRSSIRNILRGSCNAKRGGAAGAVAANNAPRVDGCLLIAHSRRSRRPKGDGKENVGGEANAVLPAGVSCKDVAATGEGNGSRGSVSSNSSATSLHKSRSLDISICDTIADPDFAHMTTLPNGLDLNEWMASHTMAFFNHINLLYGSVSEFCTVECCPVMLGPGNIQYQWIDDKGKKSKCSAPQYVDYVMSFTGKMVTSEDLFPTKYGKSFPASFDSAVRRIVRLLSHVLLHLVSGVHWHQLQQLGLASQACAVALHFRAFVAQFALLDAKDLPAVTELTSGLRPSHAIAAATASNAFAAMRDTGNMIGNNPLGSALLVAAKLPLHNADVAAATVVASSASSFAVAAFSPTATPGGSNSKTTALHTSASVGGSVNLLQLDDDGGLMDSSSAQHFAGHSYPQPQGSSHAKVFASAPLSSITLAMASEPPPVPMESVSYAELISPFAGGGKLLPMSLPTSSPLASYCPSVGSSVIVQQPNAASYSALPFSMTIGYVNAPEQQDNSVLSNGSQDFMHVALNRGSATDGSVEHSML